MNQISANGNLLVVVLFFTITEVKLVIISIGCSLI